MASIANSTDPQENADDDMDSLINAMEMIYKNSPEDQKKTFEEKLAELDKHPAFLKEIDPSKPLSPEMEGLMQLKYECEDPTARAEAFKEDGNCEFKKKKYRVAIDNYSEAIKCKCPDRDLNAVLYSNRAAAQFHLGNYRSSLTDCVFARKFKGNHFKAIHRGALCCMEMKKYNDCITWCDAALLIEPNDAKTLELRQKANKLQKALERDKRKEQLKERKEHEIDMKLMEAIQKRGIHLKGMKRAADGKQLDPALLTSIEVNSPQASKVRLDDNGVLHWPVLFLYPEHSETDYIQSFSETHRLCDHVYHMFGPESEPPPWDQERKYVAQNISVYFEEKEKQKVHKVDMDSTLLKVLKHKSYQVVGGTPCFILTVAGSPFDKSFQQKYQT